MPILVIDTIKAKNAAFDSVVDAEDSGYNNTTSGLVATNVQDAIDEVAASSGDVSGPATSINNNIATFSGTTGKIIQDGGNTIAQLKDRANHTGTQTASTISDFDIEVSNNIDVAANTSARHDAVTVLDSSEINFTLTGQQITASLVAGSIDETKLDASVNASLDLADSAVQTESDPVVGAVNGLVKANGAGTISAAVEDVDYQGVLAEGPFVDGDKTKLNGIESGAEVNNISDVNATDLTDGGDSTLHYHSADRNRANHTGTQTASTISDFDTEVSNNIDVAANTSARHTRSHAMTSVSDHSAGNYKMFYSDGAGAVQELSHGTSGQVLTSNGITSAPSWQDATGGGSLSFIEEKTLSAATSTTFSGLSGVKRYILRYEIYNPSGTGVEVQIRINGDANSNDYAFQQLLSVSTSTGSSRLLNFSGIFFVPAGLYCVGWTEIGLVPNGTNYNMICYAFNARFNGTDQPILQNRVVIKNTGVSSITQIYLEASSSSSMTGPVKLYEVTA